MRAAIDAEREAAAKEGRRGLHNCSMAGAVPPSPIADG